MRRDDERRLEDPKVRAVRAQPALARMGEVVVAAVADALQSEVTLAAHTLLATPDDTVALQIVAPKGQLGISVTGDGCGRSLGAARAYEADTDDGTWARVNVPGRPVLMGGALLPLGDAGAHVDFEALVPSTVYRATHDSLAAALDGLGWSLAQRAQFADLITVATTLAISPDMRLLARNEQQQIVERARLVAFHADTEVQRRDLPAKACFWVARGPVTLRSPGEAPVALALGDLFGVEALSYRGGAAGSTVVAGPGARLVALDRFELKGARADVWHLVSRTPWFGDFARSRGEVERNRAEIVRALAKEPTFKGVAREALHGLLQGARALIWRVGLAAPPLIQRSGGWAVVLEGELMRTRNRPGPARRRPAIEVLEVVEAGDCAFVTDSDDAREIGYWRARRPARIVYISRHRCDEVLGAGAATFATEIERRVAHRRAVLQASGTGVDLCLLEPVGAVSTPALLRLADALAGALWADFSERTLVVVVTASPGAEATLPEGEGAVLRACLPVEPGHGGSKLKGWLKGRTAGLSQVVVVAGGGVEPGALRRVVDQVVLVDAGGDAPPVHDGPGIPFVFASFRPKGQVTRGGAFSPSTVRFRCDVEALSSVDDAPEVAALARAMSGRRVGVALGGGGAWGYMHLAVLFHMRRRGIPVDMVSGASFGAVVGAYFAADPKRGLAQLLDEQKALMRAVHLGYVSGSALQRYLDTHLTGEAGRPQSLLETRVPFFPACTDLVTGSLTALHTGTLGGGVRASGSLPPFFAASYRPGHILLDGALSANVPAQVLENEGADLIVASEVIPAVQLNAPGRVGGWRGVLRDLSVPHRLAFAVAGLVTLAETASEMSATVARVTFSETGTRQVLPTAFDNAREVIEHAVSNPGFWNTMRRLERMWTDLSKPRHSG